MASPLPALGGQEITASEHLKVKRSRFLFDFVTDDSYQFTVDGTMNLVRQGAAMGVKKIIVTSSILAVTDMDKPLEAYDSNHVYTPRGTAFAYNFRPGTFRPPS